MRYAILCLASFAAACSPTAAGPPSEPEGERPPLTAEACEAQGGAIVGDIGDGAIHRPDYRCPGSGQPPLGRIEQPPSGPMAVEGSVCCR